MSTESSVDPIRAWLESQLLRKNAGYRIWREGETLPENYGSYSVYDGADFLGGGFSRNIARTLYDYSSRLRITQLAIFIWKPDDDGSVQRWMEQDIDDELQNDDDDECPYCHGTGLA
jgi:hypothetical protein